MKRPKLIVQILIALVLGVLMGVAFPVEQEKKEEKKSTAALPVKKEEKKLVTPITDPSQEVETINQNFKNLADKIEPPAKAPEPVTWATRMKIFMDIFMQLIKMIIAPLVFSVLVVGIAKLGDFKSLGRIGAKSLTYFISASLVSLLLGLLLVNLFQPGLQLPLDHAVASDIKPSAFVASEFVKHVIPSSVIKAMAENEILPIVVFSIFFGIAAASLKEKAKSVIELLDSVSHIMFKVTGYVMAFAPLAVFGAVSSVVALKGPMILKGYLYIMGSFYIGLFFFVFVVLFLVCWACGIKYFKLLSHIKEPVLLAFSTTSSEAAMPKTLNSLERFGCPNRITSFILSLGYSFNLDGSMMYMTFASISIAQAYGIEMTLAEQLEMLLIFMLTSKGIAGVPRASLVVIASTMVAYDIPEAGLGLILGIDHFLDMGRSATNVVGNAVATAVVSKWEGELKEG